MDVFDYGRSFLQFTTDTTPHTPRLRVMACCTVTPDGSEPRRFALAGTCMCENMYRPSGLIQKPPAVFQMISDGREFMVEKFHAGVERDVREVHRVGERMSTHDGRGATMKEVAIALVPLRQPRALTTYAAVREAILGNAPIAARTTYAMDDGCTRVQLDYPVDTCNIAHDHEGWQIDTGPVLLLDPESPAGETPIARLRNAYILYNTPHWAECALHGPAAVDGSAARTAHYARLVRLEGVRNELFAETAPA